MSGPDARAEEPTHGLAEARIADRYDVGGLLGRGGMGEVRAGVDRRLHRPVAIKMLRGDLAADSEVRARFDREARAAARLVHPHVVAVFDTGEEHGVPYIVMERLPGTTLADRIAEGPLPPDEACRVGSAVLDALGAAHEAGIVHRDVKPGNVLLAGGGGWKVADFGIAKSVEPVGDLTVSGSIIGTPAYVAPERFQGAPADPASDLYSVGVLLYESLAGCKPFEAESPLALVDSIRSGRPVPLEDRCPEIDPSLAVVVDRAIERDPRRRFADAVEMRDALERRNGPTAITVPDVRRSTTRPTQVMTAPPRRPRRARSAAAALAAGVLLALGLGAAVALNRDEGGSPPSTEPVPSTIASAEDGVTATGEPLPAEYSDALEKLEEAVRP